MTDYVWGKKCQQPWQIARRVGVCPRHQWQAIILNGNVAEFAKDCPQICFTAVAEAEKINIACRAVRLVVPKQEQHCALQDEAMLIT